jgi:acyl-CoA reductase-like NAD-dependent aldehyde dehydrogenase
MPAGFDQGMNPATGEPVGGPVPHTSTADVDRICRAAAAAARPLAELTLPARAALLRAAADAMETARRDIVALADQETGLGATRLDGELTRTVVQLELFAHAVTEGSVLDIVIDLPDPSARPAPRPDLRRMLVPLGPVAVFSASNFPLAFSVAGGDTASALAAGCPVVVKAHSGHPGLSVLCGQMMSEALARASAPAGSFAVIHGTDAGRALITHPAVTAGGFTGSLGAGRALFDLASQRPDPIPFYGELGSLNPTVVTAGAIARRGADLAADFVGSLTLGAGQFCTKPGLLFLPKGHGLDVALADALRAATVGPLLNARIRDAYRQTAETQAAVPGTRPLLPAPGETGAGYRVAPQLLAVSAADLVAQADTLLEECFGPAALVVEYGDADDLDRALDVLPGSLTATVHANPSTEDDVGRRLVERFATRAGRVIWAGWPTGVAVTWAMQHGGPWPATTGSIHTSVGVTAIRRFQRPVVYQGMPQALLPELLRDANPLGIPRRVNGVVTTDPVGPSPRDASAQA